VAGTLELQTLAEVERVSAVSTLRALLAEAVGEDNLTPYSQMLGSQPRFEPYGTTLDALQRVGTDRGADEMFAVSMMARALVRVIEAVVAENAALERRVAELEAARKPAKPSRKPAAKRG
jgi:hypothetical protein